MWHYSIRAEPGTLLFHDWIEARALWDRIVAAVRVLALVLMPDPIHVALEDEAACRALIHALRGYALWRHRHRGESGPVWRHLERPSSIEGPRRLQRLRRYIALNPCRRALTRDPLDWPFSTHRDAVGLAIAPIMPAARDPARFHAYVSGDPSVNLSGTTLPAFRPPARPAPPALPDIFASVSALTRSAASRLHVPSPERDLFIRAARALSQATSAEIADMLGRAAATIRRHPTVIDHDVQLVDRVLGDPRFALLADGDLRREPAWSAYRRLR